MNPPVWSRGKKLVVACHPPQSPVPAAAQLDKKFKTPHVPPFPSHPPHSLPTMDGVPATHTLPPSLDDEEAQPFFRARIFLLPSQQAAQGSSNPLLALKVALQGAFHKFLQDPVPTGAEGYIFNRSPPSFSTVRGSSTAPPHVVVECSTGTATEDAHLLLHFLRLQQRTLLSQCAVQVHTEDGELLLIEAADHLPQWIDPSNADGRVWMVRELVAVIPPEVEQGQPTATQDACGPISDYIAAFAILSNPANAQAVASPAITDAAFAPLTSYPDTTWIETVQHRTTVYLPTNVLSAALASDTQLISRAARAFLGREGTEVRVASRMSRFLGGGGSGNDVGSAPTRLTPIPIPRRVYAQLLSQRFMPPKAFPPPYRDRVSAFWEAIDSLASRDGQAAAGQPLSTDTDALHDGRRWDLGCKLTVGLEVAYCNDKERLKSQQRKGRSAHKSPAELRSSPEYPQFIDRLTSMGYFHGELTGSAKWQALEREAVASWQQTEGGSSTSHEQADHDDVDWVDGIDATAGDDAVSVPTIDPHDKARLALLELDDSWLWDVDAQGQALGDVAADTDKQAEQEATQRLSDFSKRVESFIAGKGDVEGALADDGHDDDDEDDEDDSDDVAREEARKQLAAMQPAEREQAMKALVSGLEGSTGTDAWARGTDAQVDMELDEHLLGELRGGERKSNEDTSSIENPQSQPTSTRSLSPDAMRAQMSSYRKGATTQSTSLFSSQQFDGAESWQLDSEPEDSEDEQKESKEVRKERARLLDLSESESEDEQDEETIRVQDEHEEMTEFLDFARKELGLSQDQLRAVIDERKESGRWVPGVRDRGGKKAATVKEQQPTAQQTSSFGKGFSKGFLSRQQKHAAKEQVASSPRPKHATKEQEPPSPQQKHAAKQQEPTSLSASSPPKKKKEVSFVGEDEGKQSAAPQREPLIATTAPAPPPNKSLSTFDSLMAALDTRLDEHRAARGLPPLDREEYYGKGEIRSEDWALRREGGASLGSVMKQEQERADRSSGEVKADEMPMSTPTPTTATSSTDKSHPTPPASSMDIDEGEDAPLQANDPSLLDRLMKQEEPSAFRDMIHGEMEKRYGHGDDKAGESTSTSTSNPLAVRLEEKNLSRNRGASTRTPKIQEIIHESNDANTSSTTTTQQRHIYGPDSDGPPPMSYGDSDSEYDDVEITGPGDGEYDPIDAEDMDDGRAAAAVQNMDDEDNPRHASSKSLPEMLDDDMDRDEDDDADPENLPTIVDDSEMISNLMESWRAQGADPGPVGLMFGGPRGGGGRK